MLSSALWQLFCQKKTQCGHSPLSEISDVRVYLNAPTGKGFRAVIQFYSTLFI